MLIDVLGKKIPVKYEHKPALDCGKVVKGYCDLENEEIVLESILRGVEKDQTLIHEIIHMVWDRIHADVDIDDALLHIMNDCVATVIAENFKLTKR